MRVSGVVVFVFTWRVEDGAVDAVVSTGRLVGVTVVDGEDACVCPPTLEQNQLDQVIDIYTLFNNGISLWKRHSFRKDNMDNIAIQ